MHGMYGGTNGYYRRRFYAALYLSAFVAAVATVTEQLKGISLSFT